MRVARARDTDRVRNYHLRTRMLHLSAAMELGQRAFQRASALPATSRGAGVAVRSPSRAAEALRNDIELFGQRFGVSLDTVCHSLSTRRVPT